MLASTDISTPAPTETSTPIVTALPTFEVVSCEHAADLIIELRQNLLDAQVPSVDQLSVGWIGWDEAAREHDAIFAASLEIGCVEDDVWILITERLDQLRADDYYSLTMLGTYYILSPVQPPRAPVEICDSAADVYIDLVQATMDETIGLTLEEVEALEAAGDDMPQAFLDYRRAGRRLIDSFLVIGCPASEMEMKVATRIDRLEVTGEVAQEIFMSTQMAIANGELFN